jgi:hypothetical protein
MQSDANDPRFNFEANPTLEELFAQQGKGPVDDLSIFQGGWPEDERVEDFIAALREWRGRAQTDQNDRAA